MTSPVADPDLGRGVVAFLHHGSAASPQADDDAVRAVRAVSSASDDDLVERVRAVVRECLDTPVDWASLSLGEAGRAAAAETGRRHPGLDQGALDALAWQFSFAWR